MNSLFIELTNSEASSVVGGFLGYTNVVGNDGNPLTDANAQATAIGNSLDPNGTTTALTRTFTSSFSDTGVMSSSESHSYINYF